MAPGLAEQAVSKENGFSQSTLSLDSFWLHQFHRGLAPGRKYPSPTRATPSKGGAARVKGDKGGLLTGRLLLTGLWQDREVLD